MYWTVSQPSPKPGSYFAIYVLSSKLDIVNFPKIFPTRISLKVLVFFIEFCRTEHIVEAPLHHLLLAVVVAINARSWAWPIRQDARNSSIFLHRVFLSNRAL